jgi:hypothetical protein
VPTLSSIIDDLSKERYMARKRIALALVVANGADAPARVGAVVEEGC